MDTKSLVYNIKTDDFYEGIASDVKAGFDTSDYRHSRVCPLPMGGNKKVIDLMKDEIGIRAMTQFVALRLKLYTYKTLGGCGYKKFKGVKKCIMKKMLEFKDYMQCLLAGQNMFRKQLLFLEQATRSPYH